MQVRVKGRRQGIICGMYQYHGSAQVMVLDKGYQSCIYLGYEGDLCG